MSLLSVMLAALLALPWWITRAMNSLRDELSAKIDVTNARIDQQRIELTAMIDKQRLELTAMIDRQRIELTAQIDALGKEVAVVKTDVAVLKTDTAWLRERTARIETRLPEVPVPAGD